ncbi:MAG: lysylphosphatidylglycerol synthase domain-containing protein, partial [Gemmatimonadota bacterium]
MRSKSWRLAFAVLAVLAAGLAGREILTQWRAFRASGAHLEPRWSLIVGSSLVVLLAYAVLVETWRRTVRAWDAELPWIEAARIWFISNLGRYLPGKVWQIGAMGVMAQERGVSVVAATGSALVINLVNLLAGFGLVLVTGAEFFDARGAAIVLGVLLTTGIVLAPRIVPVAAHVAGRVLRRPLAVPRLPDRAVWLASIGCLVAWILYGVAFQIFVAGVLGSAPGRTTSYIAAFTGSYLAGYIALFAPGGIGVREKSLMLALGQFGLAQAGQISGTVTSTAT